MILACKTLNPYVISFFLSFKFHPYIWTMHLQLVFVLNWIILYMNPWKLFFICRQIANRGSSKWLEYWNMESWCKSSVGMAPERDLAFIYSTLNFPLTRIQKKLPNFKTKYWIMYLTREALWRRWSECQTFHEDKLKVKQVMMIVGKKICKNSTCSF